MDERCIIGSQRECMGLERARMLEKQMDEYRRQTRETHTQLFHRIQELEKAGATRDEQYKCIMEKLDRLLNWQEEQQAKPGRRWESVTEKVILAVVAAVVGFILAQVGL